MQNAEELERWKNSAKQYLFLLALLEKAFEEGRINKKKKKEIEKKLNLADSLNYWKLNPFIKENSLLREVAISFFEADYLA